MPTSSSSLLKLINHILEQGTLEQQKQMLELRYPSDAFIGTGRQNMEIFITKQLEAIRDGKEVPMDIPPLPFKRSIYSGLLEFAPIQENTYSHCLRTLENIVDKDTPIEALDALEPADISKAVQSLKFFFQLEKEYQDDKEWMRDFLTSLKKEELPKHHKCFAFQIKSMFPREGRNEFAAAAGLFIQINKAENRMKAFEKMRQELSTLVDEKSLPTIEAIFKGIAEAKNPEDQLDFAIGKFVPAPGYSYRDIKSFIINNAKWKPLKQLIEHHKVTLSKDDLEDIGCAINWDNLGDKTAKKLANLTECYRLALEAGADLYDRTHLPVGFDNTILHTLLSNMDFEQAMAIAKAVKAYNAEHKDRPIHLETPDAYGKTALQMAVLVGATDIAKALVIAGADVNTKDKNGITPLHRASVLGNVELVEFLLDHGAKVNAKAVLMGLTPLHCATKHKEAVEFTLKSIDIDPNKHYQARYSFPLRFVPKDQTITAYALSRHEKVAELLLERGADTTITNIEGRTAEEFTKDAAIKQLIQKKSAEKGYWSGKAEELSGKSMVLQ